MSEKLPKDIVKEIAILHDYGKSSSAFFDKVKEKLKNYNLADEEEKQSIDKDFHELHSHDSYFKSTLEKLKKNLRKYEWKEKSVDNEKDHFVGLREHDVDNNEGTRTLSDNEDAFNEKSFYMLESLLSQVENLSQKVSRLEPKESREFSEIDKNKSSVQIKFYMSPDSAQKLNDTIKTLKDKGMKVNRTRFIVEAINEKLDNLP